MSNLAKKESEMAETKKPKKVTKPLGRPTTYKPEYKEKVLDLMKEGASLQEVAGTLGVTYNRFYEWCQKHNDLQNVVDQGVQLSMAWWEKQGRKGLYADKKKGPINSRIWEINMRNRFNWDSEQQQTANINITFKND